MPTFRELHGDPSAVVTDLDADEVYYRGERLTDERAESIALAALAHADARRFHPGASVVVDAVTGETVDLRDLVETELPAHLHERLERVAKDLDVPPVVLVTRAVLDYLRIIEGPSDAT